MKNFYMFTVLSILMCSGAFAATYTYYTMAPFDIIYTDNECKSVAHNISNSYRSGELDIITNGYINADKLKEAVRKLSNGEKYYKQIKLMEYANSVQMCKIHYYIPWYMVRKFAIESAIVQNGMVIVVSVQNGGLGLLSV